jgi:cyclopropane fatty-acyl-phospholipid synthase-like methyltransferase
MMERWDDWNASGGPKYPQEKIIQFCLRHYPLESRSHIRALDLGCGSGANTLFLAMEGFHVRAVDGSSVAVSKTIKCLENAGFQANVEVQVFPQLSLLPHSLDLVVCVGVLECIAPAIAQETLATLSHAMSKGSRSIFLFASDSDWRVQGENHLNLHGYTEEEVRLIFSPFCHFYLDRYITTYRGRELEENQWLVTVEQ